MPGLGLIKDTEPCLNHNSAYDWSITATGSQLKILKTIFLCFVRSGDIMQIIFFYQALRLDQKWRLKYVLVRLYLGQLLLICWLYVGWLYVDLQRKSTLLKEWLLTIIEWASFQCGCRDNLLCVVDSCQMKWPWKSQDFGSLIDFAHFRSSKIAI